MTPCCVRFWPRFWRRDGRRLSQGRRHELNRKRFCSYCIYRSRCNRGAVAGDLEELDDPETYFVVDPTEALEFTLDDVEEIEF